MIYLLLGSSGSGKDTIANAFKGLNITKLTSHTTRRMRVGENGTEYNFVSKKDFSEISFVETTEYSGNFYGLSIAEIEREYRRKDVFAIMDAHGISEMKKLYPNDITVIYVYAPMSVIEDRMLNRGDDIAVVKTRMNNANETGELDNFDIADYIIYNNGTVKNAISQLRDIVTPTIYMDVDGVVLDSLKRFVDIYNKKYNTNHDPRQIQSYNFKPEINLSADEIEDIFSYDIFYNSNTYLYENVINCVTMLHRMSGNVKFVTLGNSKNIKNKSDFLNKLFPTIDIISINKNSFTHGKSCIKMKHNDIFVDDVEDNLITSNCRKDRRILFCPDGKKEYNENFRGYKAQNMKELYVVINNILKGVDR